MNPLTISLNPTYLCNFRCNFCYLTPEQLADKSKLDLFKLEEILLDINNSGYYVEHVDLYGGEVGLLSEDYIYELDSILQKNGDPTINVITNLLKFHPYFNEEHVSLSVSYDFEAREKQDIVLQNILKTKKDIAILMLASPQVLGMEVNRMINMFNHIENIKSVEIKPYSSNQANVLNVSNLQFEEFVKKWIFSDIPKRFEFTNLTSIKNSLNKTYNAFSNNHVYITPQGKIAVLDFDRNDNELFVEMNSMSAYETWSKNEKIKVTSNLFCRECPYLGNCLTEHYREVKSIDKSCNGYRLLLDWAKDQTF